MNANERITASGGYLKFGNTLCFAIEQVQHISAVQDQFGIWRLEVKCSHRAAPWYPFEGTESAVRGKLKRTVEALRREKELEREREFEPWKAAGAK